MKSLTRAASRLLLAAVACLATAGAHADGAIGDKLPADFPVILDASLGEPLIGFGATGTPTRTPVVFVHGNNDTPFPTACNPYGRVQAFAKFLLDHGYAPTSCGQSVTRATSATCPLTKPFARVRPTRPRPTCPTCALSCSRCFATPARAKSTSWRTASAR